MVTSRRALLLACTGLALWPFGAGAQASPEDISKAQAFIGQLGAKAISVLQQNGSSLEERERQFRALLAEGFAMEFIARFVLGRHWNTATEEQREDYLQVFTEYVLRTYSRRLGGYAGEEFAVIGGRPAGQHDILVQTRIDRPSAADIMADWRVRAFDGELRIIDIMVEGVSMAVTQRSEFAAVISRDGFDGLLQALRARTQRFPASS
jgi:phospholipid transport system substrate-binding protein